MIDFTLATSTTRMSWSIGKTLENLFILMIASTINGIAIAEPTRTSHCLKHSVRFVELTSLCFSVKLVSRSFNYRSLNLTQKVI